MLPRTNTSAHTATGTATHTATAAHAATAAATHAATATGSFLAAASTKARRLLAVLSVAAMILAIGAADFLTGDKLSFQLFYFLPVCLAVVKLGRAAGAATAATSIAISLGGDLLAGARYPSGWVPLWNALAAFGIHLLITDDGAGLPPAPAGGRKGIGLRIMNHRAAMIGATLDITTPPEGGTRVECRLPLKT